MTQEPLHLKVQWKGTVWEVELPRGSTGFDLLEKLFPGQEKRKKKFLGYVQDGEIRDFHMPLREGGEIRLVTWEDPEGKTIFWHTSAHMLAQAVQRLIPDLALGTGPPLEQGGFYYDMDLRGREVNQEWIQKVEEEILRIARENLPLQREVVPREKALEFYRRKKDPYKQELIQEIPPDEEITFYRQGEFVDLCRGPHLPSTGYIRAVKILNVSEVFWRGNPQNPRLTRIYAITFPSAQELQEFLRKREEALQRDHRRLGKQLRLFAFSPRVGSGLPLWLPRGAVIRHELETFLYQEQVRRGYQFVYTPHIARKELYELSGHFQKYHHHMFQPMRSPDEDEEYILRPMNCPHHCEVYRSEPRSYRELPLRIAEYGTVYRYEQSGELAGLLRVRGFTVDDAHIFCTPDQLLDEFLAVIDLVRYVLRRTGFEQFSVTISLRDPEDREKYIGSDEIWDQAENAIRKAVEMSGLEAREEPGEAAFYGPKLDFTITDALGRKWQVGTIQVDYNLPERFDLTYMGPDNQLHRPVMIHRAPFGSLERFTGILIEHTGGRFPFWLAPIQVAIIPVSDRFLDYARQVSQILQEKMFRVWVDARDEKVSRKIRDAEVEKIPVMLIVGEREQQDGTVSVRTRGRQDRGTMSLDTLVPWLESLQKGVETIP